ncbi:MAG: AMP-binding protein, partial [Acidobacteria bacterium]|nr:AMP-binding protein [Acidobacteriota bacterium]
MRIRNMVDLLRTRADAHPARVAYTFLESGEQVGDTLTWGTLDLRSRALGAAITSRVSPGSRVLVMLPPGIDFASAFFGILYA